MNDFYIENEQSPMRSALMKVYDGVKHTDASEEFILPDYLPDIKKIIRVDTIPKIDGKYVNKGRLDFEGDVVVNILYVDEGNHLRTVTFTVSFADGVEVDAVIDECIANLTTNPESVICKTVNPRRVSVRMRLDTDVTVWCVKSFEPEYKGEYSEAKIERSERELEVMKLVCAGESGLNVSADLEADGALPQIGEVISCNVDISFYECKGSDGKVLCRGDMPITVFYSSPSEIGETYTVLYRKLPIAQVVLCDGVEDDYSCMARGTVDNVKVTVSENGFGERRIVMLDVNYRIYLNGAGRDSVKVISDVYSYGKDVKTVNEIETFYKPSRVYSKSFSSNLALSRDQITSDDADSVFAVKATPKVIEVTLNSDKGTVNVSGISKVSAIFQSETGLNTFEYEMPFSTELDGTGISGNFIYNCDIVCMNAKGRFDSENYYTELELSMNIMLLEAVEASVMKKAEFSEREQLKDKPQMRFYYPEDGETFWSIGKAFDVSVHDLKEKNGVSDETLPKVIFIP